MGYFYFYCKNWAHVQQQQAVINLGSASSIVRFIVGGMNTLLNGLLLAHKVLAFALSRLKGVACEAIYQLKYELNKCLYVISERAKRAHSLYIIIYA